MVRLLVLLTLLCPFGASLSFDDAARTVSITITQGELLGTRIDAYDNRTGYGFLGVPFGKPTDGARRFAKPEPAGSWESVRDVTKKGDACAAVGSLTYKRPEGGPMSEDCLHSYIYTTKTCLIKGGCPIMWVLHGGRYNFESPVVFVDEVIVHNFASEGQDVVVVIPAYRLSNFGFLNLAPGQNISAPPNVAVWDLLLAMQWLKREAHFFGGNPDQITVFGHSAGSQFTDIISVSPHFEGTFNRMVLMSGADVAYEAGQKSNSLASWISAEILGCAVPGANRTDLAVVEQVIACMRAKTWQEIVEANVALNTHPEDYRGPHMDGPGGILPEAPSALALTRPLVSIMIGTVSAEFHETKYALDADGTPNLLKTGELCEAYGYATGYEKPDVMSKRCIDHYMQGKRVASLEQDTMFFMPTFITARGLAKKGNKVYVYSFRYKGVGEAFKKYRTDLDIDDVPSHSEDYVYILGMHRGNFTARDYEIEKIYSGMVLNFVKSGYPHPGEGQPVWKPFSKMGRAYYEIDFDANNRMPGMRKGYEAEAIKMWVDDAEKYGGPVTPPTELPLHSDRLYPLDLVEALASHHMNMTTAHDKTLQAMEDNYKSWTEYVNNRRFKHLQGIKNFRAAIVEQPSLPSLADQPTESIFLEILVIALSAVIIFILLRCCLHCIGVCQERKGYQAF